MIRIVSVMTCMSLASSLFAIELNSGVISRGKDTIRTEEQAKASVIIGDRVRSKGQDVGRSLGITNLGVGNLWFRLGDKMVISSVDVERKEFLYNSPLVRWSHELASNSLRQFYHLGPKSLDQNTGLDPILRPYYVYRESPVSPSLGCMGYTPVRYGDIEADGKNELVLILSAYELKSDFVVFSPDNRRIIFSTRFVIQDAIDVDFSKYQFVMGTRQRNGDPGVKLFAKIFKGDFDADGNTDFIVWRKRFKSLNKDDALPGFKKVQELFTHYERDLKAQAESEAGITGEYLPQDTSEEDIKNWLAENELTWSKGYPSKSECPGEEGELIPEMHDPLLNDPDVLK